MFMVVTEYFVVKKCGGSLALKIFCAMFMVVSEYFVVKKMWRLKEWFLVVQLLPVLNCFLLFWMK